jgi:c-di-GMP phosphodiesterase
MLNTYKYAVFCVDDDPMITTILGFQLRKMIDSQHTIVEVSNNPEEVELHFQNFTSLGVEIVLLIVDYQMPNINGADLIRKLKLSYPELTCIMLSGQANNEDVFQLLEEKMLSNFVKKPWDESSLRQLVDSVVLD